MIKQKKISFISCIYITLFISTVVFLSFIYYSNKSTGISNEEDLYVKPLQIQGVYKQKNTDKWVKFEDYDDIIIDGFQLIIKGKVKENIPQKDEIFFYMDKIKAEVFVNDKNIYSSNDRNNIFWGFANTDEITTEDEITILLETDNDKSYNRAFGAFLDKLSHGGRYALMHKYIKEKLPNIIICFFTFGMGISLLFVVAALWFLNVPALKGYISCALLFISGGICTFMDYDYITLIFNDIAIVNIIDFISQLFICEFLIMYLSTYIKYPKYKNIVKYLVLIWTGIICFYFIFRVFGMVNEVQIANQAIIAVIILVVEVFLMINEYIVYNERRTKHVLYSGIMITIFTGIEIYHYYITHVFWVYVFQIGISLFAIAQFAVLMKYTKENIVQASRAEELEKRMIQNKIEIMLSQIKPHFLYNTLGTIKALCLKDIGTARTAIDYFSKYLRSNMNAISESRCIPFYKELEHVKCYLYIEKLRFGDLLDIEYEIEVEDFSCPPLLLQTIVENSVKHGICKKAEGGTVTIKTYETDYEYVIQVLDDGVGFDINKKVNDNKRLHIGIENTKQRLKEMCNGTIDIKSRIGFGTKVTIEIEKDENEIEIVSENIKQK
ncbi:sensor histidine kinase [uncultured Clostridium sp.]|uniref:sensor histidine kinase n=1 Tax=uncultured Clostridium sp. TaxID=59620 RepID=UPI0025E5C764|nr:histidine kinase [uncultured Clostridium sp.]